MGNGKTNRYAFVFYPESVSFDHVFSALMATHTKSMISPLHNNDVWDVSGCYNRYRDLFRSHDGMLQLFYDDINEDGELLNELNDGHSYIVTNRRVLHFSHLMPKRIYGGWRVLREATFCDGDTISLPVPGDLKKDHYHCLCKFDYSMTSENALKKIGLNDVIGYLEPVNSEAAYTRYLCHLDDPDKYQYDRADVVTIGGYCQDPLYYQDQYDIDQANASLYEVANDLRSRGGDFSAMLDFVYNELDWKAQKAFRSNQAMWRNYLVSHLDKPK